MAELHNSAPEDNPEIAHEESDVDVRAIIGYGAGLAVVCLIVGLFLWWLQGFFTAQTRREQTMLFPMAAGQRDQLPPTPRLQDDPQQDLRDLVAKQQGQLSRYSWVDKEAGIARIPIEDAMRIVVQRGLPAREPVK